MSAAIQDESICNLVELHVTNMRNKLPAAFFEGMSNITQLKTFDIAGNTLTLDAAKAMMKTLCGLRNIASLNLQNCL